jgi:hypothetical protein
MSILAATLLATAVLRPSGCGGTERVPALARVFVLGASLSQGYGLERDAGAPVHLADVVEASLRAEHEPVRRQTALLFFTDPLPIGRSQVEKAAAADPTLVVGIDFLFWYGYGSFATEAGRMAMLENGLALLETFRCPVIVGDFPDVADASRDLGRGGGQQKLLAPEQVPPPESLKQLNVRLRSWAGEHKSVVVVPLADLVARLHSGKDVEIRGNHWSGAALAGLIQRDRLHPTLEGEVALWLGSLDAFVRSRPDLPDSAFDWDAGAIAKRIRESRAKPVAPAKDAPAKGRG